jgi:hypothetical protein
MLLSKRIFFSAMLSGISCTFAFGEVPGSSHASELTQEYLSAIKTSHEYDLPTAKLVSLKEGQVAEMLTWTSYSYTPGSQVLSHEVWVVEAAEMKKHCDEILKQDNFEASNLRADLRVDELLGMPPPQDQTSNSASNSASDFVLIKVPVGRYIFTQKADQSNQADLSQSFNNFVLKAEIIRPCFTSGDVSSESCTYPDSKTFRAGDFVGSKAIPLSLSPYQRWIENIKTETADYPWTGLGYTYDWSPDNPSHIGLSEFILPIGSEVEVEKSLSIQEFCGK